MNLKKETEAMLRSLDKTADDVLQVIYYNGEYHGCSYEDFLKVANIEYDETYGRQEINDSLKIVFNDHSWLERFEYDGAEEWVYKRCPNPFIVTVPITKADLTYDCAYCMEDEDE